MLINFKTTLRREGFTLTFLLHFKNTIKGKGECLMFKKRTLFAMMFVIILSLVILPHGTVFAKLADGQYEINYEMKESGGNNTSIADGYFGKPAKVTVKNGTYTVQITLSGAEMIKSLSAPSGPVNVISDSGDTRVVSFTANDLSQPITMDMHIVVPKGTPGLEAGYDMNHKARAVFNLDSAKEIGGPAPASGETPAAEDNPPTGDNSQIMFYALLLVGSAGALYAVRKLRPANN